MRKSRYTDSQIIAILQQAQGGAPHRTSGGKRARALLWMLEVVRNREDISDYTSHFSGEVKRGIWPASLPTLVSTRLSFVG